jgi:1,4-alpha-glucan branching enzyme
VDRNKIAFWMLVTAAMGLVFSPSIFFASRYRQYTRLLDNFERPPLRQIKTRTPNHPWLERIDKPRLDFTEFRLRAPKAKTVELLGDFNAWKPGALSLTKASSGEWEIALPLPQGKYRYLFLIDGTSQPDPKNSLHAQHSGRSVSVKVVTGHGK